MIKLDDTPKQEGTELKPCPFCGGKAEIHKELIKFLPEAQYGYRAFCSSLYCAVSPYTELYIKLESAVETWNRRADVVPVVHGEWKRVDEDENAWLNAWMCTSCGDCFILIDGNPKSNNFNYCPNCGAKLDGKGGEQE